MANAPIPSVVAMLVCDQIITEQGTNKKSLIGIFENMFAGGFPVIMPRLSVYVKLVDGEGKYVFKLRLVKLRDEGLIAEVEIPAEIRDSMQPAELVLNMANIPLPEPGKYEFQLYTGDVYLHRATMDVIKLEGALPWQQPQPPTKS